MLTDDVPEVPELGTVAAFSLTFCALLAAGISINASTNAHSDAGIAHLRQACEQASAAQVDQDEQAEQSHAQHGPGRRLGYGGGDDGEISILQAAGIADCHAEVGGVHGPRPSFSETSKGLKTPVRVAWLAPKRPVG